MDENRNNLNVSMNNIPAATDEHIETLEKQLKHMN